MHRLARDLGALRRHDYSIGGGSALYVGPALLSVPELRDTEETYLYQRISQLYQQISQLRPLATLACLAKCGFFDHLEEDGLFYPNVGV